MTRHNKFHRKHSNDFKKSKFQKNRPFGQHNGYGLFESDPEDNLNLNNRKNNNFPEKQKKSAESETCSFETMKTEQIDKLVQ